MITIEQVKDIPFKVKVTETDAFIREVPYHDQAKKPFQLVPIFDQLANHALHNHYRLSFFAGDQLHEAHNYTLRMLLQTLQ